MNPESIKSIIDGVLGDYAIYFLGAAFALFFKGAIENYVSGLIFYFGSDYNVDDEVYIKGVTKARIVRQTFTKTVFYLSENNRRLVIQNRGLNMMQIEKVLPAESDNTE